MTDEPTTELLLRRLRDGEPQALAALLEHYRPRLRQMLRLRMNARLAARLDASDVLQETYLDAARQLQGYLRRPTVAFYVWLRGLACERLLNLQRQHLGAACRAAGREAPLPADSSTRLGERLLAPGTGPSQALLRAELRQRVQRALARLPHDDREVILMRHFEDLTNGEVAQALGLSASAATMRYGRALFRLKELLQTEFHSGGSRP
jgi:RNA polymerase sigma-70 factor (ECF subfamily)